MLAAGNGSNGDLTEADQWLAEIGFKQYRPLFKKKGSYLISLIFSFVRILSWRRKLIYYNGSKRINKAIISILFVM